MTPWETTFFSPTKLQLSQATMRTDLHSSLGEKPAGILDVALKSGAKAEPSENFQLRRIRHGIRTAGSLIRAAVSPLAACSPLDTSLRTLPWTSLLTGNTRRGPQGEVGWTVDAFSSCPVTAMSLFASHRSESWPVLSPQQCTCGQWSARF